MTTPLRTGEGFHLSGKNYRRMTICCIMGKKRPIGEGALRDVATTACFGPQGNMITLI